MEGATGEQTVIGMIYRGYEISPIGSVIGFIWAFIDGYIGGLILAWLYNKLSGRMTAKDQSAARSFNNYDE